MPLMDRDMEDCDIDDQLNQRQLFEDSYYSTLSHAESLCVDGEAADSFKLANTQFLGSQKIDVLIGADHFWDLLIDGKMRLPSGPFLQNTKLGWIISGPIDSSIVRRGHVQCNVSTELSPSTIDDQLRKFWELEELTLPRNSHTEDELACEQSFVTNTTRENHGRFVVHIPLKNSAEVLGESYSQAKRRFLALEKRLSRAPSSYKQLYVDFMREYVDLGHMTKVDTYSNLNYFLPHHGVFREHSTTTKLRVVFDASAATCNGISFNDIQRVGPPIQGDLLGILLRFRQFRFTAKADCAKMYRQVLVAPSQRDLQLIIWREDTSKPLDVYCLNTVTYGTASAPFLSVRCLKQLATECSDPEVRRVINNDMYVDDLLTSGEVKVDLLKICKDTADTLSSGCFPLRKWVFNFELDEDAGLASLNNNNDNTQNTFRDFNFTDNIQRKTLGLGWCNMPHKLHMAPAHTYVLYVEITYK
ncbi:uncharacterized protein LOC121740416 [Aricia agestis]|uniref:uncharacterized protein LOC121740416 n=1 Tax=Aricia agestis TaxID=91739 RepID=UPI001C20B9E8|nr:uncharacterized protein LOC121740416 [Aricia agestis]